MTDGEAARIDDVMPKDDEQGVNTKTGIVYAAVFSVFLSVVSLMIVGWLLDRWLNTSPWLVVAGIVLGATVGFYQFIRLISKVS